MPVSLLGLLSFPLDLHEPAHNLELRVDLLQSSESKFDVSVHRRVAWQHVPHGSYYRLVVKYTQLAKLSEICAYLVPESPQLHKLGGLALSLLGKLEG